MTTIVVFKGKSKKGNIYYSVAVTSIIDGVLIKSSGLIFEDQAKELEAKGHKIVDVTNKK